MAFELPPLPYDYGALEPTINEETMKLHHDKHHAAYTSNLNAGVTEGGLEGKSIEDILGQASKVSAKVRNNGGGFWNHDFFWKNMAPNGGSPAGKLDDAIADFGGPDKLHEEFNPQGAGTVGSGGGWRSAHNAGTLNNHPATTHEKPHK